MWYNDINVIDYTTNYLESDEKLWLRSKKMLSKELEKTGT